MAINTQTIRIDLNTGRTIPVAFAHQNDTNRQLTFQLYNNGVAFTPSSTTVKFAYKSPIVNGNYSVITGSGMASGTISGNTVTVTLPSTYTQVSGVGILTMILTTSGNTLRPVNIKFVVQSSADGDDVVLGASDWPAGLYEYMDDWLAENEPTEIANLKSDLRSFYPNETDASLWSSGGIASSNGERVTAANRIRISPISRSIAAITPQSGYKISVFVYNSSDTFLGVWNGSELVKGTLTWFTDKVVLSSFDSSYIIRVVGSAVDNSNILASDGEHFVLTYNLTSDIVTMLDYNLTDVTTWAILEQGGIDSSGNEVEINTRLRSRNYIHGNYKAKVPDGFLIYSIAYYDEETDAFNSLVIKSSQTADIGISGCKARITVSKTTITDSISLDEIKQIHSLEDISNSVPNSFSWLILEQGGIDSAGNEVNLSTRLRSVNYIHGNHTLSAPTGFKIYSVVYYDEETGEFSSSNIVSSKRVAVGQNGYKARITISKSTITDSITIEEIKSIAPFEEINHRVESLENTATTMLHFDFDHTMIDVSEAVGEFDFSYSGKQNMLEQVYDAFDGLVSAYPNLISRTDVVEELGMTYPSYCNGIETSGTYEITPAYKMYMYTFQYENTYHGANTSPKTMLFVSGNHGNEYSNPVSAYIFAKNLCTAITTNADLFKLATSFRVCFVPCFNGYGMYHLQRQNANGVNLNRNFPVKGWTASGSAGDYDYTGASAGSEFETQVMMALTELLSPDIAVDHHNYGASTAQFYTMLEPYDALKSSWDALTDCSYTFKKNYPTTFGSGLELLRSTVAPLTTPPTTTGFMSEWWYQFGVPTTATLEISNGSAYVNGEYTGTQHNVDDATTFSIAEYQVRNQLLHYVDWLLKHHS